MQDSLITRIQNWYKTSCNGDWEHSYGVSIETLTIKIMKNLTQLLSILLTILLLGCGETEQKSARQWKTIEVGDYLFDFPADFELIPEQGIDSYVGRIQGYCMCFHFDFGYYSSDFEQTTQEYLEDGFWRFLLPSRFMKGGITYDQTNTPKVDVLSIRPATIQDSILEKGCDYVAKCKHDKTEFEVAVLIPHEIKQMNFAIDTVDNLYRKMVWDKNPRGTTGIYLRDVKESKESMNNYLSLSLMTNNLTSKQQEIALKIFKSGRNKNRKK